MSDREKSNDSDSQIQRGVYRMVGKLAAGLVGLVILALGGWLASIAVGQGVQDQKLAEHERRIEEVEKLTDRLHAIDVDVQVLVRSVGMVPAPRPPATRPGP